MQRWVTHERGTCGLGFEVYDKSGTLNGWRCLDEKIIDPSKSDNSH